MNMPKTVTTSKPHILSVALVTLGLLLIMLVAAQFMSEARWGVGDFVAAGALIFGVGLLIDLVARKAGKYRLLVILAIVAVCMWIWAELAVGVFTTWGS